MQVTINVPDDLAAQAQARGIPLETYVQDLLGVAIPRPPTPAERERRVADFRAWLKEFTQFSGEMPEMPGETFSREMIYGDHD
jgi:hypothetical protein